MLPVENGSYFNLRKSLDGVKDNRLRIKLITLETRSRNDIVHKLATSVILNLCHWLIRRQYNGFCNCYYFVILVHVVHIGTVRSLARLLLLF